MVGVPNIASLDERVRPAIQLRIVAWAVLGLPSTEIQSNLTQRLSLPCARFLQKNLTKPAVNQIASVLQALLGIGLGGGDARKRFVEDGDNGLSRDPCGIDLIMPLPAPAKGCVASA